MNALPNRFVRFIASFLVALSAIGFIASQGQYVAMEEMGQAMLSERTLEESFVVMLQAGIARDAEAAKRSIDEEARNWRHAHEAIQNLTLRVRRRQLLDSVLWVAVFLASALWLLAERRMARA